MKKGSRTPPGQVSDGMRKEYDFSSGVRGATAKRYAEGANVIAIAPDVADVFPDAASVNEVLRAIAPLLRQRRRRRPA